MNHVLKALLCFALVLPVGCEAVSDIDHFLDAESFDNCGGWVIDQQSMDVLGSPYLLAHGAGVPVGDASTAVPARKGRRSHVYVLTHNWTSPWSDKEGPGAFTVIADGDDLGKVCGTTGEGWEWQYAGCFKPASDSTTIALHDLSGFDGRCDAVCISSRRVRTASLPVGNAALDELRLHFHPELNEISKDEKYDFVVIGGGISGICAAVTASRLGLRVAIANDRPVLGGNNSAEIRVHLGGRIELDPYPNLGNLIKEFGHSKCSNADRAEAFEDWKKEAILREAGVDIYAPFHAMKVDMEGNSIKSVYARGIASGELIRLSAPLFAGCTGDGTLGVMAGADYVEGREARATYNESMAPENADNRHLGASLLWNSKKVKEPSTFPEFNYGMNFSDSTEVNATKSQWYWETGLGEDMITEVEKIRDFGLLAIYSNWSWLKNHSSHKDEFSRRELDWVAYITGKRESRRLLGDHILTENDIVDAVPYPDGTCSTSWGIDLHEYREDNSRDFPGMEFMTIANHKYFEPYPIPYRCLYSRNIPNLFMAGRDISCSHVAMGSVRVIRTCGMMGEVVGMAASVCHAHSALPRNVYESYLAELQALMREGAGKKGLPNDQTFCIHGCYPPAGE